MSETDKEAADAAIAAMRARTDAAIERYRDKLQDELNALRDMMNPQPTTREE